MSLPGLGYFPIQFYNYISGRRSDSRNTEDLSTKIEGYENQVRSIWDQYNKAHKYGSGTIRTLIDLRSVAIAGRGINAKINDKRKAEWIENFLRLNKLRGSGLKSAVIMSEIEGIIGFNIVKESYEEDGQKYPKIQRLSWLRNRLEIESDQYGDIVKVKAKEKGVEGEGWKELKKEDVIFIQLAGIEGYYSADLYSSGSNDMPSPLVASVLYEAEVIDRCVEDWRKSNSLYGVSFPYFESTTVQDAREIGGILSELGQDDGVFDFGEGKALSMPAKCYYPAPPRSAAESLKDEIINAVKIISGRMSIPPYALGFPDVFGTKAGIEEVREMVSNSTASEREAWENGIKKIIVHASELADVYIKDKELEVQLAYSSTSDLERVNDIFAPLMADGIISESTVRAMIPNIDPEKEKEMIEKEKEERMERMNSNLMNNLGEEDGEDEEE